jgi:hypothetical protein
MGFVFDDGDPRSAANPIAEMQRLITSDPRNAERIFPYLGGDDFNSSPTLSAGRFIIDFGEMTLAEASLWRDLFALVEARVKPARAHVTQRDRRELWWLHATRAPSYRAFMSTHKRCLMISMISNAFAFGFIEGSPIIANTLSAFLFDTYKHFSVLQSRIHEAWARFFASSMKDDLRYTPSDCFETFPFPKDFEIDPALESAGQPYYEFRADLMVRKNEGLTKTYNRFHDPDDHSPDILKLRELHTTMDRAVLDAYDWHDLAEKATCEFLLDYEEDEDEEEAGSGRRRKKPWRYRWPDDFRDEVLARLLELNRRRAEEERLSGAAAEARKKTRKTAGKKSDPRQKGLF